MWTQKYGNWDPSRDSETTAHSEDRLIAEKPKGREARFTPCRWEQTKKCLVINFVKEDKIFVHANTVPLWVLRHLLFVRAWSTSGRLTCNNKYFNQQLIVLSVNWTQVHGQGWESYATVLWQGQWWDTINIVGSNQHAGGRSRILERRVLFQD